MHELIGSSFDELIIFTPKLSGYVKREIRDSCFWFITYKDKRKCIYNKFYPRRKQEFVVQQILSTSTNLPEIDKLGNSDKSEHRRVFQGSELIIEKYLKENDVKILIDGRKDKTVFEVDNYDLIKTLRAGFDVENFDLENELILPEEIGNQEKLFEGAVTQRLVNSYERNLVARQKCIEEYGCECNACGFNMEDKYGEIAREFIHVHHIKPLSEIDQKYEVNAIKDLIPLCPNCHSIIHRKNPPYTIDEWQEILVNQNE